MQRFRLYVGCALSEAPPEFREEVESLKAALDKDYEVLRFLGLVAGTPRDVYQKDIIENVGTCDLMLAVCDYPSTGMGVEIAIAAVARGAPVLAVAHEGKSITRIITGMAEFYPNLVCRSYSSLLEDVPALLKQFAAEKEGDIWDHELGGPRWAFKPVYLDRESKS